MVSLNPAQFQQIYDQSKDPGGGATVNVQTGAQPSSGWAVAMAGHEHRVPTKQYTRQATEDYAKQHAGALDEAGHLGLWHQRGKGVYHDVTKLRNDTYLGGAAAIAGGYRNKQEAVYNIDRDQTLHMDPPSRRKKQATRAAVKSLRSMSPQKKISEMPTAELKEAFKRKRPI